MIYIVLFIFEIVIIFFLSRRVQRVLSHALVKIFKNKNISIYVLSILFFPGTFVHEVSHFLAALFLLVPVGNMQLIPKIEEDEVRLGSVSIAKTDPIRRFLIGAAPLFVGASIVIVIPYLLLQSQFVNNIWLILLSCYMIFTISNSMFSSKRDMEGLWGFVFTAISMVGIFWYLGLRIDVSVFLNKFLDSIKTSCLYLLVPIIINILVIQFNKQRR